MLPVSLVFYKGNDHQNTFSPVLDMLWINRSIRFLCSVVKIKAVDARMAREAGAELIEHSLNVLRLYGFGLLDHNPLDYKMDMGIEGTVFSDKSLTVSFRPAEQVNMKFDTIGALYEYTFSEETIQTMDQFAFQSLNLILKKEQENEFERLLNTSIDFRGLLQRRG